MKNDKFHCIRMENFCSSKDTINKAEGQVTNGEK